MLTQIPGEPGDAAAIVWADDPGEARRLLRERTGKDARVCTEIQSERGVWGLIAFSTAAARASQEPGKGDPVLALLDEVERERHAPGDQQ
jgi:hypothetical protein